MDTHAHYALRFYCDWGGPDAGAGYPADAHTGNFFALSHGPAVSLFRPDELASPGVAETSMFGTTGILESEFAAAPRSQVLQYAVAGVLPAPGSKDLGVLEFDQQRPLLSLTSMIAPSPDWFFGVCDVPLFDSEQQRWHKQVSVPVWAFSAGTDHGKSWANAPDFPRDPPDPIRYITGGLLFRHGAIVPHSLAILQCHRIRPPTLPDLESARGSRRS